MGDGRKAARRYKFLAHFVVKGYHTYNNYIKKVQYGNI
jgi:hypothetical protein